MASTLELLLYPKGLPKFVTDAGGLKRWAEKDDCGFFDDPDMDEEDVETWTDNDYTHLLTWFLLRKAPLDDEESLHFTLGDYREGKFVDWDKDLGDDDDDYGDYPLADLGENYTCPWKIIQRAWRKHSTARRNKAALKIQQQFKEAISNPKFKLCRRRLMREFNEM